MIRDDINEAELDLESTGDDNHSEPEIEDVENSATDKIKQLKEKLKASESERRQYLEDLQRAKADFLNSRKRMEVTQADQKISTENDCIESLMPLCDSFKMAMSDESTWQSVDATWRAGVEGIYNQLQSVLNQYQVAAIEPVGETFDPAKHEAVGNEPVNDSKDEGIITKVLQPGYERTLDGKSLLLRPARVIVGTAS